MPHTRKVEGVGIGMGMGLQAVELLHAIRTQSSWLTWSPAADPVDVPASGSAGRRLVMYGRGPRDRPIRHAGQGITDRPAWSSWRTLVHGADLLALELVCMGDVLPAMATIRDACWNRRPIDTGYR